MLAKRYNGRLVKHMQRVKGGIELRFFAPTPGERGERKVVTQREWDQFGTSEVVHGTTPAQLRQREVASN